MPSKYQLFVDKWGDCNRCHLCETREKIVIARGSVPADVLFIGEAPGEGEDSTGIPFIGPAGRLLDDIITKGLPSGRFVCQVCQADVTEEVQEVAHSVMEESSIGLWNPNKVKRSVRYKGCRQCQSRKVEFIRPPLTYCLTNLVCCIPRDEDGGKAGQPSMESIQACAPRLVEFVDMVNPRLLVRVGKMASQWIETGRGSVRLVRKVPMVDIPHPAGILRANISQRDLFVQRCIVTLQQAVEDYLEGCKEPEESREHTDG